MRIVLFVMVGIVLASGFGGGIAFIITRTVKNRADEPVEVAKEQSLASCIFYSRL